MVLASGILGKYQNCLAETVNCLNKLGLSASSVNLIPDSHSQPGYLKLKLSEPLYFQDWPFRTESRKKIDIVATIKETICLDDGKCIKSSCYFNYFQVNGANRIACDAIHYDFDASIQEQHPICHAQNMSSIFKKMPPGFPEKVDSSAIENRQQAIRIPTAFVNLAGLIEAITADHLSPEKYEEFWDKCAPYVEGIPVHADGDQVRAICESNCLRSRHWYKH